MDNKKICANLYGPVPSRRLGFSLGVDFIPFKTCSLDCIYCQLGHVPQKTVTRKIYIPASRVLSQIREKIDSGVHIDHITFSGSGEPTLNAEIGKLILDIKHITKIPVAVLTNGTLLQHENVRKALMSADLVIPSLDAASQEVFEKINRPHPTLRISDIIAGLKRFRREFKGKIWIEILLVKGVNDTTPHLEKLKDVTSEIHPDKVQLNTVVRPPAVKYARALTLEEMERVRDILGGECEIIAAFEKTTQDLVQKSEEDNIMAMIRRRPMTLIDMAASLGLHRDEVMKHLQRLLEKGGIQSVHHKGQVYYEPKNDKSV